MTDKAGGMFELFLNPRWFSMLSVITYNPYCVGSHMVLKYDMNPGQCYMGSVHSALYN